VRFSEIQFISQLILPSMSSAVLLLWCTEWVNGY